MNAATRKNMRKGERKASRKAERKADRKRANNMMGGRKASTRRNRGVFSTLYAPAGELLHAAKNVASSGLNTAYAVPATFVKGAKNTVRNSVSTLANGVDNIGRKATSGVNRALSSAFSRRNNSSRRNERK